MIVNRHGLVSDNRRNAKTTTNVYLKQRKTNGMDDTYDNRGLQLDVNQLEY